MFFAFFVAILTGIVVMIDRSALIVPGPVIVAQLFPEVLEKLLELLSSLSPDDWNRPTVCSGWSVKTLRFIFGVEVSILRASAIGFTRAPQTSPIGLICGVHQPA